MNTLIFYDSAFCNTGELARAIAGRLGDYGRVELFRIHEVGHVPQMHDIDVVIIGGPTHRHGLSLALQVFLKGIPRGTFRGMRAAAFDTRYRMPVWKSRSAAPKIARRLKQEGATLLAPPRSFVVMKKEGPIEEKEVRDAIHWAEQLFQTFEAQKAAVRSV